MAAAAVCTFEDFDPNTQVSASQQSSFDNLASVAALISAGSSEPADYAESALIYIAAFIWGFLLLAFLILAFLPLSCARCCCTTRCCAAKDEYVVPGYPSGRCDGYGIATVAWIIFYGVLVALSIYMPFAWGELGTSVSQWSCVVVEVADQSTTYLAETKSILGNIFDALLVEVDGLVSRVLNIISDLRADTTAINVTVQDVTSSLAEGCNNITSSEAYQNLDDLSATGFTYNCDDLDIGSQSASQLVAILDALTEAEVEVSNLYDTMDDQLDQVQDTVDSQIDEIIDGINQFEFDVMSQELSIPSIPILLANGGSLTYEETTTQVTQTFPSIGALWGGFLYLGLVFWLIGILVLGCNKCAAERESGGNNKQRALEIKNSCCGRCLMKLGCVCSYWGAFILCFVAILFMILSPAFNDLVTLYYVAPYNSEGIIEVLEDAGLLEPSATTTAPASSSGGFNFNINALLGQVPDILNECFFGAGSVLTVLSGLGLGASDIINSFVNLDDFDIAQYADLTDDIDVAQTSVTGARNELLNNKFDDSVLAIANYTATFCCNYTELFALFTNDCDDPGSTCFQCEQLSTCTDPTPCNTSGVDGDPEYECNKLARSALIVMTNQNTLLDRQIPKIDSVSASLSAIAAEDYGGQLQTDIEDVVNERIPDAIEREASGLSCSEVATIYYGIHDQLLEPVARSFTTLAVVLTLIIFLVILVVFLQIPVDVRLGNDGIDLNNVQQSVIRSVQSTDVAIEMTVSGGGGGDLPVAEPVRAPMYEDGSAGGAYEGNGKDAYSPQRTDEYGNTPKSNY
eukprot:INCI4358.1.p1 GENE.INCI4358.1~~INCI4358.1.p1  ORF type:complete len:911 (-),score=144.65 INCI4358.1:1492-3897(-)